jgi:hypothetical protein
LVESEEPPEGRRVSAQMYVESTVITPAMQVVATASMSWKMAKNVVTARKIVAASVNFSRVSFVIVVR